MAIGRAARTYSLDVVPIWRPTPLVRMQCQRQWRVLRPSGCEALWSGAAVRVPALLSAGIRGATRRTDGSRSSSLGTPAPQVRGGLRWPGWHSASEAEVD